MVLCDFCGRLIVRFLWAIFVWILCADVFCDSLRRLLYNEILDGRENAFFLGRESV